MKNPPILTQSESDDMLTLTIDGESHEIKNLLSELKSLLQKHQNQTVQYADKIYNIAHINEANFGIVTSNRLFNTVLTKAFIELIPEAKRKAFLDSVDAKDKENWECMKVYATNAQNLIQENFIWIIAWELRRLFSIGKDKEKRTEQKIDDYISHCFSTYRLSLQLLNAVFLSKLWDCKKQGKDLDTNISILQTFFHSGRKLKLIELRTLFQALLRLFQENELELPLQATELGEIAAYLSPESAFNKACLELEDLERIEERGEAYDLASCHTAEIQLATILTAFPFFANYQLVSMKKVEYEEIRNKKPRYIKDYSVLGQKERENLRRIIQYDDKPSLSYVVFFRNQARLINLFPFILDYNALTNEADFKLFVYEHRYEKHAINYYCTNNEQEEKIVYQGIESSRQEVKSEKDKDEQQKNIKLDIVIKQFEDVLNTLLDSQDNFQLMPAAVSDNFDNL